MRFEGVLAKLLLGKSLTALESYHLFLRLFRQEITEEHTKAILLLLAQKGETADELYGAVKALRELEPSSLTDSNFMDTCGTGGDGQNTINVSSLAALVIAGAGGKVAKHGNKSISSKCGSSDLFQELGIKLDIAKPKMVAALKQNGLGYFHAPFYHPVFGRMQSLRQKLKVRTIFNLMGPLVNPMGTSRQVVGVAKKKYFKLYAEVLRQLEVKKALVCHSRDGMDEISINAKSDLAWVSGNKVRYETLNPQAYGFTKVSEDDLRGGTPIQNAKTSLKLLEGKLTGPKRDIVVLNAAAGLVVAGIAKNLKRGLELAAESLDQGFAYNKLLALRKIR